MTGSYAVPFCDRADVAAEVDPPAQALGQGRENQN